MKISLKQKISLSYSSHLKSLSTLLLLSYLSSGCVVVQATVSGVVNPSGGSQGTASSGGSASSKTVGVASEVIINRLGGSIAVGSPISLKVTVADFQGNPVTNFTGTINLIYTADDGISTATLPVFSHTFSAAEQGVFIFSGIVFNNAVNYHVTAQNKSGQTVVFSNSITLVLSSSLSTQSTDATLSALTSNSGTLSPSFSSGTTNYTVSITNGTSSLTLTPTVNQANATVKVNGVTTASGSASAALPMSFGANTVTVVTTAQDGSTQKTYTLTVTRALSSVATLSSLTLSSGTLSPTFASGTTSYTASITNATSSITVTPSVTQANAAVKVNGTTTVSGSASAALPMSVGSNTVTVLVTAQDGTTNTYSITVTRAAPSTNADLSGLSLSSGGISPNFLASTLAYKAITANNTSVTITPTVSDTGIATVTVNGTTVASGAPSGSISIAAASTVIPVVVTAGDGVTTKTYNLTIYANQGVVTTLAGSGAFGDADGTGAAATFSYPMGVVLDSSGNNLYVTDYSNDFVRKVTTAGVVTTIAGSGGGYAEGNGTAVQFDGPTQITFDLSGNNLLIADKSNYAIRNLTLAGDSSTLFRGIYSSSYVFINGLAAVGGVVVDSAGNTYLSDNSSNVIYKVSGATPSVFAGTSGSSSLTNGTGAAARFNAPSFLAADSSNNIYVADDNNHAIRKITPAGVVTTFAGGSAFTCNDGTGTGATFRDPYGITSDYSGNLYVGDYSCQNVRMITPAGVVTTLASVTKAEGVAVDSTGTVYVASLSANKIKMVK